MAGIDHDLESVIIDLSITPLDQLSALDDEAITAVLHSCGDMGDSSSRTWSSPDPPRQ